MEKSKYSRKATIDTIEVIVKMTQEGALRSEIAEKTKLSKQMVYLYQKRFDLI